MVYCAWNLKLIALKKPWFKLKICDNCNNENMDIMHCHGQLDLNKKIHENADIMVNRNEVTDYDAKYVCLVSAAKASHHVDGG